MNDHLPVNLFAEVPRRIPQELTQKLLDADGIRIERIVSTSHRSPEGFWYDQDEDEWVAVLCGEAVLRFDDDDSITLLAGDHVLITAHRRHRVESTSQTEPTIWLAVFFTRR